MPRPVGIVATGTANLASVEAALRRLGAEPRRVEAPAEVAEAELLVLPGVGTLGAAMARLDERGLFEPLRARLREGRATLAVCLGLQLLAEGSEESPEGVGFGLFPGLARRFPDAVVVPQLGWNRVSPAAGEDWLEPGHAYFANSFCLESAPDGWCTAWAEHGVRFLAAAARGRVLACQFHPELSGAWGEGLLRGWLEGRVY